MTNFWLSIIEQGFIFGIMVLGVYITYRILDFPDLSVDGSFPLGASVTASLLVLGINPVVTVLVSTISGALAGLVTGLLHVKLKITNLLSGILVMIGLYSVNLRIMGKSNIPLFNEDTLFTSSLKPLATIILIGISMKLILDLFLKTKAGFLLRAIGNNPKLVTSLGINTGTIKIIGLMISNGLVALAGSLMAQYQGFSDVGMGSGIIVTGLASVIIGESLLKRIPLITSTTMVLIGSIIYRLSIAFALELGFSPSDNKLITAIIVVIFLATEKGINKKGLKIGLKGLLFKGGDLTARNKKSIQDF